MNNGKSVTKRENAGALATNLFEADAKRRRKTEISKSKNLVNFMASLPSTQFYLYLLVNENHTIKLVLVLSQSLTTWFPVR